MVSEQLEQICKQLINNSIQCSKMVLQWPGLLNLIQDVITEKKTDLSILYFNSQSLQHNGSPHPMLRSLRHH